MEVSVDCRAVHMLADLGASVARPVKTRVLPRRAKNTVCANVACGAENHRANEQVGKGAIWRQTNTLEERNKFLQYNPEKEICGRLSGHQTQNK